MSNNKFEMLDLEGDRIEVSMERGKIGVDFFFEVDGIVLGMLLTPAMAYELSGYLRAFAEEAEQEKNDE